MINIIFYNIHYILIVEISNIPLSLKLLFSIHNILKLFRLILGYL